MKINCKEQRKRISLYGSCVCWIAGTICFSCQKELDLEHLRPAPSVVINCVAGPNAPICAVVRKTSFFSDGEERSARLLRNAEVTLSVNDTLHRRMVWDKEAGMYISGYQPESGDRIRIEATTSIGKAWAEDIVPKAVRVDTVYTRFFYRGENQSGSGLGNMECRYHIVFDDRAGEKNYYFLRIMDAYGGVVPLDYTIDEVFKTVVNGMNSLDEEGGIGGTQGMAFSDELFDGQTYTLRVGELFTGNSDKDFGKNRPREIQLYAVSESYYRYLLGIFNEDDESVNKSLADIGLAEPQAHHSNINGGTGILGTMCVTQYKYIVNPSPKNSKPDPRL